MAVWQDRRTGRWRAEVEVDGRRIAKTLDSKRLAERWLAEQRLEAERGTWLDPRRGRVPLREVHARWTAARSVGASMLSSDAAIWRSQVEPTFGSMAVNRITKPQIKTWLAGMTVRGGKPASRSTRKHALRILREALQWAVEEDRIRGNPAQGVPVPGPQPARREALTLPEVEALLAALPESARPVVRVLTFTGLRRSELAALNVGDVCTETDGSLHLRVAHRWVLGPDGRYQRLRGTKAGEHVTRSVPVLDAIRPDVEAARRGRPASAPLFASPRGDRIDWRNWQRHAGWKSAVTKITRPDLTIHALRHTAATLWLSSSKDVKVTQEVMGHASGQMTLDVYGHVLGDQRAAAVTALNATVPAPAPPN